MNDFPEDLVNDFGIGRETGSKHYRAWVGPPQYYDLIGAVQFNFLTTLGLREYHTLLDIGCGSLRGGRLAIIYLRPNHYFGIEPESWLLEQGNKANLGEELINMKKPSFSNDANFTLTIFNKKFDFLLAHSIFTHASGTQIAKCLQEARKVMKPQSIFLATFHEAKHNYEGDQWVYPGITQYTKKYITQLVENVNLKCTHLHWPHPWNQKWFIVTDTSNHLDIGKLKKGFHFSASNHLPSKYAKYIPIQYRDSIRSLKNKLDSLLKIR